MRVLNDFLVFCKEKGVRPPVIIRIMKLRLRGFKNVDIALNTGLHRTTVQKYLSKIKGVSSDELLGFIEAYENEGRKR